MWIRRHLSFANAISMIALFVALGGTTYAAVALPKNSVGSKQVKKNSLKAADIGRNAVGASEIRSNSVRGGDVGDGSIGSLDIGDNAIGGSELSDDAVGNSEMTDNSVGSPEVTDGSLGENDLQPGLLNQSLEVTVQTTKAAPLVDNAKVSVDATCPAGTQIIGGGGRGDNDESEFTVITSSRPFRDPGDAPTDGQNFTRWRLTVFNPPGGTPVGPIEPEVWAICVALP